MVKTNGMQMREALHAHAQDRGMGKFMSQPIFNNWRNSGRKDQMKQTWYKIIRSFIDSVNADGKSSDDEGTD